MDIIAKTFNFEFDTFADVSYQDFYLVTPLVLEAKALMVDRDNGRMVAYGPSPHYGSWQGSRWFDVQEETGCTAAQLAHLRDFLFLGEHTNPYGSEGTRRSAAMTSLEEDDESALRVIESVCDWMRMNPETALQYVGNWTRR